MVPGGGGRGGHVILLAAIVAVESIALLVLGVYCLDMRIRVANRDGIVQAMIAERRARASAERALALLCGRGAPNE